MEFVSARVSQSRFAGFGSEAKISPLAGSHGDNGVGAPELRWAHISGWAYAKLPNMRGLPGIWNEGHPVYSVGSCSGLHPQGTQSERSQGFMDKPLWRCMEFLRKVTVTWTPANIDYTSHHYYSQGYLCCHNNITLVVAIMNEKPSIHPYLQKYLQYNNGVEAGCMHHTNQLVVTKLVVKIPEKGPPVIDAFAQKTKRIKALCSRSLIPIFALKDIPGASTKIGHSWGSSCHELLQ